MYYTIIHFLMGLSVRQEVYEASNTILSWGITRCTCCSWKSFCLYQSRKLRLPTAAELLQYQPTCRQNINQTIKHTLYTKLADLIKVKKEEALSLSLFVRWIQRCGGTSGSQP